MPKRREFREEEFVKLQDENLRLKKSIDDLLLLNQLAKLISSTMPLNQILNKVVSVSVKAISAEQGTISLLKRKEGTDPFQTYIRKRDQSTVTGKYRLDEDLSGWMIKNRRPLMINDFSQDDTFKGEHAKVKEIRSVLSVPLLCKGKLIGVLNLFNKKHNGEFSENDQRLLSIMASQSAQVIENARLYEEEKQLRQIEQELETARSIQIRLLPKENPKIPGFDIAGISYPATEVGGDYFDFIGLENNRWTIALGDISGKGIPAALLMANLQATLRNQALSNKTLLDCISSANHFLYLNTETNKFVTLFCGVLDPRDRVFTYVNCGHNFPYRLNKDGEFQALEKGGIVLGMLSDYPFEQETLSLAPEEIIVIYSDGVTEAEDHSEALFGESRLQEIIKQNKQLTAKQLIDKIYADVQFFARGKKQDDDITMVIIKAV